MKSSARTVVIYRDVLLSYSETFIAAQAAALERWQPVFAGMRRREGAPLPPGPVEVAGNTFSAMRLKLLRRPPKRWREAIAAHRPGLIHAHFGTDGFWAMPLARALAVPLMVTFHGFDATAGPRAGPLHAAYSVLRPRVFQAAARVVAVSRFIGNRLLEQGCPPEKLVVHHIGVDTARFTGRPGVTRQPLVLFVGRLVEKKGCEFLLRAMAIVQKERPEAGLVIIGDGPLRRSLEALAAPLWNVRFEGAVSSDAVRHWMERASLFCLPSVTARTGETEGLPVVLLEAQSMGLPVVTTAHAGATEAVLDGQTGLLLAERDVPGLAAAIGRLLDDAESRNRIAAAAREAVRRDFDLRRQTAALEDIYDQVYENAQAGSGVCLPLR